MAIIGIDIGTTGAKAVAFDDGGKPLGSAYKEYGLKSPLPGHLELDPQEALAAIREVIGGAVAACRGDRVRSFATSTLGEAAVPVDDAGRPLGNAIIGFDARGQEEAAAFRRRMSDGEVFAIAGAPINAYHTLFKLLWRRDHEPEVFRRARRFLCFPDLTMAALGLPPRIDVPVAARTLALDIHRKAWSEPILAAAGLPDLMAPPIEPGEPAGTTGENDLGLPRGCVVAGGLHDQAAGIVGAGIRPGESMLATGTVVCLGVRLAERPAPGPMVKNNLCYYPTFGGGYVSLAWNFTGGSLLKWFRDQLCGLERAEAARRGVDPYDVILEGLPEEPTRLTVLPHFTTTGTPWIDARALGAVLGLRLTTTRKEIAKAILEGIAYEVKLNAEILESAGAGIRLYKAIGGAAKSAVWMQLYADVLDRPVAVLSVTEGAALGAALMGARAAGIFPTDADAEAVAARAAKVERVFEPRPAHARAYGERFAIYRDLYPATRDITHRLFDLGIYSTRRHGEGTE
jgi:xylulokinase